MSDWPKIIVPIVVALVGALGISLKTSSDAPSQIDFSRAAIANCESGNDLRGILRELILSAPDNPGDPAAGEAFVASALEALQPVDCQALVNG